MIPVVTLGGRYIDLLRPLRLGYILFQKVKLGEPGAKYEVRSTLLVSAFRSK